MDKSYVTLEQKVCLVCGAPFDTGNILMDQRLRNTFEHHTITGWALCPEHQKLHDDGYVALVAIDPKQSGVFSKQTEIGDPGSVYRTGEIVHIRRTVWPKIFGIPVPDKPVAFVEPGVIDKLKPLVSGKGEANV